LPEQRVEGLTVAAETDDKGGSALSAIPGLGLMVYDVAFAPHPIGSPASGT
jgi:hypothetical protein